MRFRSAAMAAVCGACAGSSVCAADALKFDFSPSPVAALIQSAEKNKATLTITRCAAAPKMDGQPDDAAWRNARAITELKPGGAGDTRVRVCFDDDAIYVLAECKGLITPFPAIREPSRDSNDVWADEHLEMWFTPVAAGETYQFVINAGGLIYDGTTGGGRGAAYNPEWQHAAVRAAGGWVAEAAIPKAALKLQRWPSRIGFDVGRNAPGKTTRSWAGRYGDTSQGNLVLEGVTDIAAQESGDSSAGVGQALKVSLERFSARPGERCLEVGLHVRPQGTSLGLLTVRATLFALGEDKPAAQTSATPTRNQGVLLADLRTLNLKAGRLRVELMEGEKRLALSENLISVQEPETPLAAGAKIPVLIDPPEGVQVQQYPVNFGVPFAAGQLWDTDKLRVVDKNGKELPCQKEVTGRWAPDGAAKWVRFDALVTPGDGCFVEVAPASVAPATPVTVAEQNGKVILDTGVSRYVLAKGPSPVEEIWVGNSRVAASSGTRGLYVIDQTGRTGSASADDEKMDIEARGPVAACVRFEGFYKTTAGEQLARHITRVEVFAGRPFARITHTLILTNDTNKVWFKDIGWEFGVVPGEQPRALFGISRTDWQKSVEQALDGDTPSAYLLQDQHYLLAHGTNHCAAAKVGKDGKSVAVQEGDECGDWSALVGAGGGLQMACRETARQHPKEFEVFRDRFVLHLFSNRAGEELDFRTPALVKKWDLVNWYKNALSQNRRPDAEKMAESVAKLPNNAAGWAKTHELLVLPVRTEKAADLARYSWLNTHPIFALASPDWICKSRAMGPLHPKDMERFPEAERYIDATFKVWEKRVLESWGDFGFVDYFSGPHLEPYGDKYMRPYRYANLHTYTLRSDLWQAYARSGDRRIREFATETNLRFGDDVMAHWSAPGKTKGLYTSASGSDDRPDSKACLPFYWGDTTVENVAGGSRLDNFTWLYNLTGCRRAREFVLGYAEGIKKSWTVGGAKRDSYAPMTFNLCVQAYEQTWDPALRDLADATADINFLDPEGALGLSKDRNDYRSSVYKTRYEVVAFLNAWQVLGRQRYYDLSLKTARYLWPGYLGGWPVIYANPQGVLGNFLYDESGRKDPSYPQMLALQLRQAATDYNVEKGALKRGVGAENATFVFQGIPYAEELMVQTGADKGLVASWVAFENNGYPVSVIAWKTDKGTLDIDLSYPPPQEGASVFGGVRVRPAGFKDRMTLNVLTERSGDVDGSEYTGNYPQKSGRVAIAKDEPEGAYEILFPGAGFHLAVAHARVPMVIYAPEFWQPAPRQTLPIKWFFSVPAKSQNPQIFFEGSAKVYDPTGKPLSDGQALNGWVNLPADKPGAWSFEPVVNQLVHVRNVPPFFAPESADSLFVPEINWRRSEAPQAEFKPPAPGAQFTPGAISGTGNQSVYLTSNAAFKLDAGPAHPSGDGGRFLPFKQGTIEFFIKPTWSSFDLPAKFSNNVVRVVTDGDGWHFGYNKNPEPGHWVSTHCLYSQFLVTGPQGKSNFRTHRRTIFVPNEWVHIAWVWGPEATVESGTGKTIEGTVCRIYVNGRLGQERSEDATGYTPLEAPKTLILRNLSPTKATMYDELRVSDIMRYTDDFTPPGRDNEMKADEHTRALFHFNGNLKGESYGYQGEVVGGFTTW